MLTDRSWLDAKATRRLIAALDAGRIEFRFVGGAVRDALLGRPVADIDVASPALPEDVMRAVEAGGLKAVPTGIAHGTITAVADHRPYEITTLRRDVETDGRHAVVAFTDDWRADAARRDFTMNALYADRDGAITDFFGGQDDARAGRVRFIGDAAQRIGEDALRILRFFRFHACYGKGALDAEGLAACASLAGMIDRLSGERVRVEILKILAAPDPAPVWQAMIGSGVMAHTIPAATRIAALEKMVALEGALSLPPGPLRRLAALTGSPAAETAETIKSRLRLSNRDAAHFAALGASADRIALVAKRKFGQALYGGEPPWICDAAILAQVETGTPDTATLYGLLCFAGDWKQPSFPLTGADLIAAGIAPGPVMGQIMAKIQDWWVAADFTPDREACLERLSRG
jgi:poly(A) polymerase